MATALSRSDAAAVKKAAKAGGLSSSSANNVVKTANANPINANVSSNSTAVSTAPHSDGSWRDPVRASNTPDGTKYTGTADTTLPGEEAPGTPPAQPGLAGIPTQVQNNIPTPTTPGAPNSPVLSPYIAPTPPPNKFQQGLAGALGSGTTAPQNGGTGKMGVAAYTPPSSPDTTAIDTYADPTIKPLMDSITQLLNPQQQTTSLLSDYNKLYKKSGLDDINQELIDADTVINGTEQNIRDEIQTAGGFGTDSQVQAMALARNKSLLTRYNQLVQMKTDATNQLNTLSQLNQQDKQMAQQRVNTQIDAIFKIADFQEKAQNNVREAFNNIVSKVGFNGAYAAYANNPQQLSYINKIMGLGDGGLEALASLPPSPEEQLDAQYKKAQIANIYDTINHRNDPVENTEGTINGKPQNTAQSQANGYADRLVQSDRIISSIGNNFTSPLSAVGSILPNFLKSSDRQSYDQAQRNFVNAVLRQESGASIAPNEFASAQEQYFPQPGDKPDVIVQKAENRNTAINNLYRQANVARPVVPGMIIESGGKKYRVGLDGETLESI